MNPANFPDEIDYRTPIVADAMRTLGYVNRFGRGIGRVRTELAENGNGEPIFETGQVGSFRVVVGRSRLAGANDEDRAGNNPERSQKMAERAGKTVERSQKTPECSQKTEERSQKPGESAGGAVECSSIGQSAKAWAEKSIPGGVRTDARNNMVSILCRLAVEPSASAESVARSIGMTRRGVQNSFRPCKNSAC